MTVSFSASNYIISGTSGFETAKACAVIEDTPRSNENQISIDDNYDLPVSVKPGKVFISLIWDLIPSNSIPQYLCYCYRSCYDYNISSFLFSKKTGGSKQRFSI